MRRRDFLRLGTATLATPFLYRPQLVKAGREPLKIDISSYLLDRTAPLFDGRVQIEGTDATFHQDAIGDMNTAAFSGNGTREVTEIGLHPFILACANDGFRDYALLPIPLLRQFRHKSIFIHVDAGIRTPSDLKGRRVGTPGYSSTSLTWIRGLLEDEYDVRPADMTWVISNKDSSAKEVGKISAQERVRPRNVTVEDGPPGLDESELLLQRNVDALIHAGTPTAFIQGDPRVVRLFPDTRLVEQDYYRRTGIYPIMHVLAIRRDTAAQVPWLARAVFKAYSTAKQLAYREKDRLSWATDMLPWYSAELEATRALMGRNFYPYGMEANRQTFEKLFWYSHHQGLAKRVLTVDEIFLEGTLEFADG
ncbi:MAG: ABC transporter substrate-binding protein [Hyphomicrobiaceae bacterium]